jgi:hypothetical protein
VRFVGNVCNDVAELPVPRSDDSAPCNDTVCLCKGPPTVEPRPQQGFLVMKVRVERQLIFDEEGCDEEHPGIPIRREAARNIEHMRIAVVIQKQDHDQLVALSETLSPAPIRGAS